ncbi:lipopolysaccharide biosynthesis protein [Hephaestia sp. GCM10023244]|uniref:lipopolysaccharide biosynthesis protein n=1 Tax=unclassified Hephaestia TaxID=2631281 RepID=UPI0020777095|nr:lipopolysaccharide biosynthesis protein [Hephaestia sp. MAHUQ-44]
MRHAVIWRSGSQIIAQLVMWASTFLVIRILSPADYGLFAMTQVVLVLLAMLDGYGLASGLIQQREVTERQIRQLFGMLIVLNLGLAFIQIALAPWAAAYYRQPAVTDLLRWQALLYLPTPFIALSYAQLCRRMDFKRQAQVFTIASVASAATALAGAMAGLGVWTLVLAPIVLFTVRAVGMTIAAGGLVRPSFDFRGATTLARYGSLMALGSFFWFVQSQADIFIAGRQLSAHDLGLYSTALFLTQIFVSKFVPPLNEVAFSAYARIQHDDAAVASAFAKSVRIIMIAAMPFYLGLAVTAEPLVLTVLGEKWRAAIPIVHLLAFAMPFMTVQVLFTPACDARGRPGIGVWNGATGSAIMFTAFLIGVRWGPTGLAWAWIAGYPLYLAASAWRSLPIIGLPAGALIAAMVPAAVAAGAMAIGVTLLKGVLPPLAPVANLAILVTAGAALYGAWMLLFARDAVTELTALVFRKRLPAQTD